MTECFKFYTGMSCSMGAGANMSLLLTNVNV